jgi:hypothetical protein
MGGTSPGIPVMAPLAVGPGRPSTTAVTFGEGRRPESRTQVQIAEFDGPLALLLSLIEARQLDVLTVPLGALADAYLDALGRLEADRLGNVSSFVAIASQLILIKSRAMLPRRVDPADPSALPDEGTDPEAELRARLLVYRAHRDAGLRLAEDAIRRIGLFRREPGAAHAAAAFRRHRGQHGRLNARFRKGRHLPSRRKLCGFVRHFSSPQEPCLRPITKPDLWGDSLLSPFFISPL